MTSSPVPPTSHDEYLEAVPEQFRSLLSTVRTRVAESIPEAVEVMSYDMPGYAIGGATVIGYAAFSKQCGLYLPKEAIADHADQLADAKIKFSKTGVTFTAARPIPDDLLRSLLTATRRIATA